MMTLQERVHSAPMPSGWKLDKLHQTLKVRRGNKNAGMREDNLLSLSYGRIIRKDIDTDGGLLPESFETYQVVEAGDIIMRLTDLQNDKRSLRQGLVKERGIITSAYDALEVVRDNEPRFWAYALLALDLAKYYYSLGGGVRQSVKFSDFPNEWIYRPDLPTQKRIAAFLDRETTRIDELIAKKELFEKAVEADFAETVTSAVIFGISGERHLKATGYTWQPETPEGWTVTRLKFLCSRIVDCLHETPVHEDDGEYPSIRTADVIRGGLLVDQAKRVTAEEYTHRVQRLVPKQDDVVYTREGERFGLAALVPANIPLCLGQRMMMFRVNKRVLPRYLMWSLNGSFAYHHLRQGTAGATSPHLNISDIRNVPIYLPPLEEQGMIVNQLNAKFEKKQRLCEASRKTIDRLREYRAALITAAVTGQIDVETYDKAGNTSETLDRIEEEMQA